MGDINTIKEWIGFIVVIVIAIYLIRKMWKMKWNGNILKDGDYL